MTVNIDVVGIAQWRVYLMIVLLRLAMAAGGLRVDIDFEEVTHAH